MHRDMHYPICFGSNSIPIVSCSGTANGTAGRVDGAGDRTRTMGDSKQSKLEACTHRLMN